MDSMRVSEAPDPGSIPGEATKVNIGQSFQVDRFFFPETLSTFAIREKMVLILKVRNCYLADHRRYYLGLNYYNSLILAK
jgi:hypothetical protein